MSKNNKSFVNAALIFGAAGILVKIIGAFYKVPLGNILGTVGSSYVATAYPYYNWLLVISTAGFPAAIAKVVAEYEAKGQRDDSERLLIIMRRLMGVLGFVTMILLFLAAPVITSLNGNPKAVYSMQAIAIALFFVSYMSAYRGYFQGHSQLAPFGLSQIVEQIGRVGLGLILAQGLMQYGVEYAAAGATFSAAAGAILGTGLLTLAYRRHKRQNQIAPVTLGPMKTYMPIIKRILKLAIPITIGASVIPLVNMIDAFNIINRLQAIGFGESAIDFYGYHAFYVQSLINFPQILFTAIQVSLLPAVSALSAVGDMDQLNKTISTGMKVALLLGVPSAAGLFVLAEPILKFLWPNLEGLITFGPSILRVMSIGLIALCLFQATTGILQGLGKQRVPARNLMIGAVAKIGVSYVLLGVPSINILGAGISTVVAFVVAVILNVYSVYKEVKLSIKLKDILVKPLVSALVMGLVVHGAFLAMVALVSNRLATLVSVIVGVVVYGVMLYMTKTLTQEDLAFLPGKKLLKKLIRS